MNELEVFNHDSFGSVRTLAVDEAPWFLAADVCMALDIQNVTQAIARLDDDERAMFNIGRQGETNFVNEPGLYALVLGSRKPEAKAFKRWITHDVIPAIRRTGLYSVKDAALSPADYLKAAQIVSRCTAANRPYVLALLEAGGIKPEPAAFNGHGKKEAAGRGLKEMSKDEKQEIVSKAVYLLRHCPLTVRRMAQILELNPKSAPRVRETQISLIRGGHRKPSVERALNIIETLTPYMSNTEAGG